MCMSCNTTNAETPRTCQYCGHAPDVQLDPQFGACEECYEDVRAEACWDADPRSTQDDSDIDPPFDYSAPEDDSDRNGGGDYRKGYECPE